MSRKKVMTLAEKFEALKCLTERKENLGVTPAKKCENCAYIDFCWEVGQLVRKKAEKYI